ncbi:MAG: radical SAM protein [Verrucomicrobiota bacterium]
MKSIYPDQAAERDRWILSRRASKQVVDPLRPFAWLNEFEHSASGDIVSVLTIFLTNRECPWRCLMCDLWKNTLDHSVPRGAIPAQITFAIEQWMLTRKMASNRCDSAQPTPEPRESHSTTSVRLDARQNKFTARLPDSRAEVKLYNSGSFFDPGAIPREDFPQIAERVHSFSRVIVECHPALVNDHVLQFRDMLQGAGPAQSQSQGPSLEIAMGLETAHPDVLEKLNKRMTLGQYRRAADFLLKHQIALRSFVLVQPPFLEKGEALVWAQRSIDFAFDSGASVVSLIPTRPGNGALDDLSRAGEFSPPRLATLESALEYGLAQKRGRVFADLWDLEKFSACPTCFSKRLARLSEINLHQELRPPVICSNCSAQ